MNSGFFGFANILGLLRATAFRATGKPGAIAGAALAGGTTAGAPTSGQFELGDAVIAQNGHLFVCTAAGSPGTWSDVGTAGGLASPLTTKGDVWAYGPSDARLPVGADNATLVPDSTQATGLAWRPPTLAIAYNYQFGGTYRIGYGLSAAADGRRFSRVLEPAIDLGSGGSWESTHVKDPCLVVPPGDGRIFCFYSGTNGTTFKIGLAISTDGGATFQKSGSNPILSPAAGWESTGSANASFPAVLYDVAETDSTKRWKMWYAGGAGVGAGGIGYAYSADGISWTKYSGNPVLSPGGGGWEGVNQVPGAVVLLGSTYYLFYNGAASSQSWYAGCATFSSPTGTYTKNPSNPLLSPDGVHQALTVDVAGGDTTLHVADATVFPLGAPVLVLNRISTNHYISYVSARPSSTTITLADAAPTSVAVGSGDGQVWSIPWCATFIRTARFDGGWQFGVTAFMPGTLTPTGVSHVELSMLGYADAGLGAAYHDYAAGLLVRPTLAESQGSEDSLENPSIAALVDAPRRYLRGAVTSVGLSLPAQFAVSGSPVTASGTLSATLATQSATTVFAGPSSGADAAPTFRALASADVAGAALASSPLILLPNVNNFVVDGTSDEQPPDFIMTAAGDIVSVYGQ